MGRVFYCSLGYNLMRPVVSFFYKKEMFEKNQSESLIQLTLLLLVFIKEHKKVS